jgi:hypothetical protein
VSANHAICSDRSRNAGGVLELMIVVATLALLVVLVLAEFPRRSHVSRCRIHCINNLKQMGLAARMWAGDNGGVFPWAVSTSSNGVRELVLAGDVATALFLSMSNECGTPKILWCPNDLKRTKEADWAKLNNGNISYFIGLDADETKPQTILSGDRNLAGGIFTSNRIMEVRATNVLVWGADIHRHCGNIGLGDGSAQQVSDTTLQNQASNQAQAIPLARFAFP